MLTIEVGHLGLAAYIKMHGQKLLRVDERKFVFESPRPLSEWRVDYNNSCCMKHDTLVCELRHHLKA